MEIKIPSADAMEKEFTWVFPDSEYHDDLVYHFKGYIEENHRWQKKGVDTCRVRARNHLMALHKLTRLRRSEIMDDFRSIRE